MDFQLECFLAVAKHKSFTKAADEVKRTQSAVTQQIKSLEMQLGAPLFTRQKNLALTKEGELFYQYALKINALYKEAFDRFKYPELDGEVRVGVPEDFATLFLADVLNDFTEIHPRIFLKVECDLTLNLMERFRNEKLDLIVAKLKSAHEFPYGVEIWKEPLVWVSSKNFSHLQEPIPLVLSPEPCVYRSLAIDALEKARLRWRMVYTSPSYAGIIASVRANMGVTALPITMIPDPLHPCSAPSLPSLPDIHVSLLKNHSSPAIDTLAQFILEKLKSAKNPNLLT